MRWCVLGNVENATQLNRFMDDIFYWIKSVVVVVAAVEFYNGQGVVAGAVCCCR